MKVRTIALASMASLGAHWGELAQAQNRVDASRVHPVTAPVKDAGRIDLYTGVRTPASEAAMKALLCGEETVFNNTCSWAGGQFYGGSESCEAVFDTGRIPSPSAPSAPAGAQVANFISSYQISYCTTVGPVTPVDIEVAFWNQLGGDCVGLVAPTPPPPSTSATAYFDLSGVGLPGSTAQGFVSCWLVTLDFGACNSGFTLLSDGDGDWDNDPAQDRFSWMWRQNNASLNAPNGYLIAGDPAVGGFGECTYNNPCTGCGTGLDEFDGLWINVDGVGVGVTTSGLCLGGVAPSGGTNCYFFGGYPTNPLAGNWLTLNHLDSGTGAAFCTANNNACSVANEGLLSSSLGSAQVDVPGQLTMQNGIVPGGALASVMLYAPTQTGGSLTGFGWLCLSGFRRIPATLSTTSGPLTVTTNAPAGCTGSYAYDVSAYLVANDAGTLSGASAAFADTSLKSANLPVGGTLRHFQAWYRDTPPAPPRFSTGVTVTLLP